MGREDPVSDLDGFKSQLMALAVREYGARNVGTTDERNVLILYMGTTMNIWLDEEFISLDCDVLDLTGNRVTIPKDEISDYASVLVEMPFLTPTVYPVSEDEYALHHAFVVLRDRIRGLESILDIVDNMFFASFLSAEAWRSMMSNGGWTGPGFER